jgi:C4-dicarboxylate-specific signal transduction histidine kinase
MVQRGTNHSRAIQLLVVDDDNELLEMLGDFFTSEGFYVKTANRVTNALEICRGFAADVIVTDLHMPDGSGVVLFQQLKLQNLELPIIIFLTGMPDVSLRATYLQGADVVLKKPVSPIELADTIKYFHEKRQKQRKSQSDLQELRERMSSVDKLVSLGIMASEIAHEIRNSLTSIQGNNLLMRSVQTADEKGSQCVSQYTRRIEDSIFRISKIIQEVQKLSSEEAAEPLQRIAVGPLTMDVLTLCGDYLRSKGVHKKIDDIPESLCVNGNAIQLSQLLVNLIQNAADAIENLDDRWIHVSWCLQGERIVLSIVDSGSGVPIDLQSQIFKPFFTTKVPGKGTGLGLSIATKIIESHGGTIAIDPDCANTKFVLTFPLPVDV